MIPCIEPDWPAPAHVLALSTTRTGGVSAGPWRSLNLGDHVGDSAQAVAANRQRLHQLLPGGARVQWLRQVHGCTVVEAGRERAPEADACWSSAPGWLCAVLTADCLPLLLTDRAGTAVAAVHAGWRGLCEGVIEAAVHALPCAPDSLMAWLGPAIGPGAFEVGPEVRQAFLRHAADADACFDVSPVQGRYLADLYGLARQRLAAMGVTAVYGGGRCTLSEPEQFYSYRRDGQTGRMATLIGLAPAA